jgi:hypothetical protein
VWPVASKMWEGITIDPALNPITTDMRSKAEVEPNCLSESRYGILPQGRPKDVRGSHQTSRYNGREAI